EAFKARFQKLIRYPIFLLWLVVVLVIFMMQYLFPQFRSLYESLQLDFPWFTRVFLTMTAYAPLFFIGCLVLVLMGCLYYFVRFRLLHTHAQYSCLLRIPVLHRFLPVIITQYFAIQLSCLTKGGLSIYESLSIFEEQEHLAFFQQQATDMKVALKNG